MPYNINKSNGDLLVTVEDGTADLTSTSIALVGRNFAGYGEYLNENLVHMLENFAKSTQPSTPLIGQLWYDTTTKLLKVYDGNDFISSGGGIQLDTSSAGQHYFTFVSTEIGLPDTKIAKEKGLSFNPNTGNFAINKSTSGSAKLEINDGDTIRQLNVPIENTVVHMHSKPELSARILIDAYITNPADVNSSAGQLALSQAPTITLRRSSVPRTGATANEKKTLLGAVLGSITARGHNGTAFSADRAIVRFAASQTWTAAGNGTKIEFLATQDGTDVTEVKAVIHGNGDFESRGDIIGFSLSDETLKTDIVRIDGALSKLKQLEGVLFSWNDKAVLLGKDKLTREVGLLAGQVMSVLPEATKVRENGLVAVNYEKVISLVIEAVKELTEEVNILKTKLA